MKGFKARDMSLIGQIVAALWIAGWSAREFLSTDAVEIRDVIYSGFAIAGCFLPVFVSIVTDKVKGLGGNIRHQDNLEGVPQ